MHVYRQAGMQPTAQAPPLWGRWAGPHAHTSTTPRRPRRQAGTAPACWLVASAPHLKRMHACCRAHITWMPTPLVGGTPCPLPVAFAATAAAPPTPRRRTALHLLVKSLWGNPSQEPPRGWHAQGRHLLLMRWAQAASTVLLLLSTDSPSSRAQHPANCRCIRCDRSPEDHGGAMLAGVTCVTACGGPGPAMHPRCRLMQDGDAADVRWRSSCSACFRSVCRGRVLSGAFPLRAIPISRV